jgi:hypothetical protein
LGVFFAMDYRTTCLAQGASAIGGGALLLLLPGPILGGFAFDSPPAALLFARMFGAALLALGGSLLAARELDPVARRPLVAANAACDAALTLAVGGGVGAGLVGPLGWVLVGLFAVNGASWAAVWARDRR